MPQTKLDNYLRTYRKNRGFSQREVAFLLSCHSGAKVSRYERSKRLPPLETIFAYEVILGMPARELFAGIQERAERRALHRVRLLARRLARQSWRSRPGAEDGISPRAGKTAVGGTAV